MLFHIVTEKQPGQHLECNLHLDTESPLCWQASADVRETQQQEYLQCWPAVVLAAAMGTACSAGPVVLALTPIGTPTSALRSSD